jgi:hypothetical protein
VDGSFSIFHSQLPKQKHVQFSSTFWRHKNFPAPAEHLSSVLSFSRKSPENDCWYKKEKRGKDERYLYRESYPRLILRPLSSFPSSATESTMPWCSIVFRNSTASPARETYIPFKSLFRKAQVFAHTTTGNHISQDRYQTALYAPCIFLFTKSSVFCDIKAP